MIETKELCDLVDEMVEAQAKARAVLGPHARVRLVLEPTADATGAVASASLRASIIVPDGEGPNGERIVGGTVASAGCWRDAFANLRRAMEDPRTRRINLQLGGHVPIGCSDSRGGPAAAERPQRTIRCES